MKKRLSTWVNVPASLRRAGSGGLTTVELLVVLGIVGLLVSISIPVLARMGVFGGQKAELAARDLYMTLRAARVYAGTHNIETAVAYAGAYRTDSLSLQDVPIIDAYAIVRKVRREDLEQAEFQGLGQFLQVSNVRFENVFIPVRSEEGSFTPMEEGMCILPDIFEIDVAAGSNSSRGLDGIHIWDTSANAMVQPRTDYDAGTSLFVLEPYFPAHRFLPGGAVNSATSRQRCVLRVGLTPDADVVDRFYIEPQDAYQVFYPVMLSAPGSTMSVYLDPDRAADADPTNDDEAEVDIGITLYLSQGRVKIDS